MLSDVVVPVQWSFLVKSRQLEGSSSNLGNFHRTFDFAPENSTNSWDFRRPFPPGDQRRSCRSRAPEEVAGPGGAGGAQPGGTGEGAERREGTQGGDGSEAPWMKLWDFDDFWWADIVWFFGIIYDILRGFDQKPMSELMIPVLIHDLDFNWLSADFANVLSRFDLWHLCFAFSFILFCHVREM